MALDDALWALLGDRAGTWAVYARHLGTGEVVATRADDVMPAQSSLKVGVLLTYTRTIGLGNDDPGRRIRLLDDDHELGSGVLRYLVPGLALTLEDVAWLMIVLSDNIATRALIRELGGPGIVEAEMDALGVPQLRMRESPDDAELEFMATAHDLAEVYNPTSTTTPGRSCTAWSAPSWRGGSHTGPKRPTGASERRCACTARLVGVSSASMRPVRDRRRVLGRRRDRDRPSRPLAPAR